MPLRIEVPVRHRPLSGRGTAALVHPRRARTNARLPSGRGDRRRGPEGAPRASGPASAVTPPRATDGFSAYSVLKLIVKGSALPVGFGMTPSRSGLDTENWFGMRSQTFVQLSYIVRVMSRYSCRAMAGFDSPAATGTHASAS